MPWGGSSNRLRRLPLHSACGASQLTLALQRVAPRRRSVLKEMIHLMFLFDVTDLRFLNLRVRLLRWDHLNRNHLRLLRKVHLRVRLLRSLIPMILIALKGKVIRSGRVNLESSLSPCVRDRHQLLLKAPPKASQPSPRSGDPVPTSPPGVPGRRSPICGD